MEKCDTCKKGILESRKIDYILLGQNLGKFNALICSNCEEIIFEGEELEMIEKIAKEKGLWGLSAKTRIGTAGNSLDVRIPQQISKFLNLKKGQEVIVEPINKNKFQVTIE